MTNKRILAVVVIPLALAILFWVFTTAFDLISAPSDSSLIVGILLACAGLFVLFKLVQFILKTLS